MTAARRCWAAARLAPIQRAAPCSAARRLGSAVVQTGSFSVPVPSVFCLPLHACGPMSGPGRSFREGCCRRLALRACRVCDTLTGRPVLPFWPLGWLGRGFEQKNALLNLLRMLAGRQALVIAARPMRH